MRYCNYPFKLNFTAIEINLCEEQVNPKESFCPMKSTCEMGGRGGGWGEGYNQLAICWQDADFKLKKITANQGLLCASIEF